MSGMKYNTLAAFVAVASNGGYIAITGDRSNVLCRDKTLRENVVIHRNDGQQVGSLDLHSFGWIIGIEFLENHSLAIIYSDGLYLIYNPATKALSPKLYLTNGPELEKDPIKGIRTDGKNIVYMTEKRVIYSKDLFNLGPPAKLYPITGEKMPLDENNCYNFSVLGSRGSRLMQVFVPTVLGGVIKITSSTTPREDTILSGLTEAVINTSVSPFGANLALLTNQRRLYVVQLSSYGSSAPVWTREISPAEVEEFDYTSINKLEWIGQFAVALVCNTKVFVVTCKKAEPIFEIKIKKAGITKFTFFTKSEIDGLRTFLIDQSSRDQQFCKDLFSTRFTCQKGATQCGRPQQG